MNYLDNRDFGSRSHLYSTGHHSTFTSSTFSSSSSLIDGSMRFPDYARRLLDFKQMDFESAFDQILTLLSRDPNKVYTSFYYRKQTKNQWARDDPAFAVISAVFVAIGTLAYAVAFHNFSMWGYLWSMIYAVVVDWMFIGELSGNISKSIEWFIFYSFN
jgi:hypothetical protein